MINNTNEDLKTLFKDDFQELFLKSLESGSYGKYQQEFVELLTNKDFSIENAFKFGLSDLPQENERPNISLASVFLAISSLKIISTEDASTALDAMVYCENSDDDLATPTYLQVTESIKKRTPSASKY